MREVRSRFARHSALILFWVTASAVTATAQSYTTFEGRNIDTIQFEPREQTLEPSQIAEILPLKMGTPLHMSDVRTAIEKLFATGRYEDIQVDAETHNNGVIIRFFTKPRWFIGHVWADGDISNPPNPGQIVNATRLELGQPFADEKMRTAREGVRRLLDDNGLFTGSLEPEFTYDPAGHQVHVRFVIKSGKRAHYTTPVLKGELKDSPHSILSATHWRHFLIGGWKQITQARTLNGLNRVRQRYEKESRFESKVALEKMDFDIDTNRAAPVLNIDAGPKIKIQPVGAKVSSKVLRANVPVYEEHSLDHDLLVEGQRNLRDYFQSQGYFEAEVEFKEQRIANDQATIDYLINLGRSHRLVHIGIQGNKYFTTEDIRERMYLQTASFFGLRHGRFSEAYLRQDEESIRNLYRSNGFRDVAVTSRVEDDYQGKAGDYAVIIQIREGPQWFVANLDLEGIHHLDAQEIRGMLSSVSGQPFSEYSVAIDRDTILERYASNGFPNANFEWSSQPGDKPNMVNLKFIVTEGQQQFVRQVLINGLETTRPSLVDRNITLNPNDPLSPIQMRETQHRLYDLGVFAKVDTAIQNPDGDTAKKYVVYDMEEARRYSLAVGFGAEIARIGGSPNTLQAPAGTTGFAPRVSLDVSRINLWGVGHSLSFRNQFSTLEQRSLLTYVFPRFHNDDNLELSVTGLFDDSRNVRTFSSRRLEGSLQLSQKVSKATTAFYRYTYRRVSVSSLKVTPLIVPLLTQPVRLGLLSGSVVEDRRDDPVDTHRGIYNTLDAGFAEHAFGSQRNFARILARNATYYQIGRKFVLARNTSFGIIQPFRGNTAEDIPIAERFFSGGASSLRAFPENQAGPRDAATGFPLGGNALLMNQTEFRFPLLGENIGGVIFHDAGNVYSSVGKISFRVSQRNLTDFDYMVHAVGLGVRYRTPIGPLRLDLAYSINPPSFFGWNGTLNELIDAGVTPCVTVPDKCSVQNISHFQFFFSIGQTF